MRRGRASRPRDLRAIVRRAMPTGAVVMTTVAVATGMATPPIGYCLFVGMAIGGVGFVPLARAIAPFIAMMIVVLLLVTFWPAVALALVR